MEREPAPSIPRPPQKPDRCFVAAYPQSALGHIVRGLGYFDDVEPDDLPPTTRAEIVDYQSTTRQRSRASSMLIVAGSSLSTATSWRLSR